MRTLGIDGGGTALKAVILDSDKRVWLPETGPVNGIMDSDLTARIAHLITQTGPDAAGLGVAGLRDRGRQTELATRLEQLTGIRPAVTDDAEAALWGAFGQAPGAIVIAGTGSAAFGRSADRHTLRLGGHGYLVGDEGSGYWIGRELVRRALRSMTGTDLPDAGLEQLVNSSLGANTDDIEAAIYGDPCSRATLADLARKAATLSSPTIDVVLSSAADELIRLAAAMVSRLGNLPIAMVGGIWNIPRIRDPFAAATAAVLPREPPAIGAARFALARTARAWTSQSASSARASSDRNIQRA